MVTAKGCGTGNENQKQCVDAVQLERKGRLVDSTCRYTCWVKLCARSHHRRDVLVERQTPIKHDPQHIDIIGYWQVDLLDSCHGHR